MEEKISIPDKAHLGRLPPPLLLFPRSAKMNVSRKKRARALLLLLRGVYRRVLRGEPAAGVKSDFAITT